MAGAQHAPAELRTLLFALHWARPGVCGVVHELRPAGAPAPPHPAPPPLASLPQGSLHTAELLHPSSPFADEPPTSVKIDLYEVRPAGASDSSNAATSDSSNAGDEGGDDDYEPPADASDAWWRRKFFAELLPPIDKGNEAVKEALAEMHLTTLPPRCAPARRACWSCGPAARARARAFADSGPCALPRAPAGRALPVALLGAYLAH